MPSSARTASRPSPYALPTPLRTIFGVALTRRSAKPRRSALARLRQVGQVEILGDVDRPVDQLLLVHRRHRLLDRLDADAGVAVAVVILRRGEIGGDDLLWRLG